MKDETRQDTLQDVLIDLLMMGADRAALVCPSQKGDEPFVCVLMLSREAVRAIGQPLQHVMKGMGDPGLKEIGRFNERTRLLALVDQARQSPCGWAWFEMPFGAIKVIGAMFAGQSACEAVARICNANGAPCSLDKEKPAPGYTIERRVQR